MAKTDDPLKPLRDLAEALPQLRADLLDAHSRILKLEAERFNQAADDRLTDCARRLTTLESVNQALGRALVNGTLDADGAPRRKPGRPRKDDPFVNYLKWPEPKQKRGKKR